jgi:hypothetical protein
MSYAKVVADEQASGLQIPDTELKGFISAKDVEGTDDSQVKGVKSNLHPMFKRTASGSIAPQAVKSRLDEENPRDIPFHMEYSEENDSGQDKPTEGVQTQSDARADVG